MADSRSTGNFDGHGMRELASKTLQVQAKKFILDVKENRKGRFIKISEVSPTGQENRMVIDMNVASDLHEQLTNFIEHFELMEPRTNPIYGDEKIKSDVIHAGERRYYLDLRENARGCFLKIAMTMPPPSSERQQIMIPAPGMVDIRDTLTDFLSEYGISYASDDESDGNLTLDADSKTFQFDIEDNPRGCYLRISEVSPSFRTAINIPKNMWPQFLQKLHEISSSLRETEKKIDSVSAPAVTDRDLSDLDTETLTYYLE